MAVVLVVDDDGDTRETLVELVETMGRTVFAAKDGQQALEMLATGAVPRPCLVLLDWIMTPTGGEQFIEILHTRSYPDVRVVLVSGYAPAAAGGWFPGVVGFVRKPFAVDVLAAVLDEYC